MESITIYPKNNKQKSLLKALLEEMEIRFEFVKNNKNTLFTEKEYFEKIDNSIEQANAGKTKKIPRNKQKEFLGL